MATPTNYSFISITLLALLFGLASTTMRNPSAAGSRHLGTPSCRCSGFSSYFIFFFLVPFINSIE
jgi:hypothetical protein